MEAERKANESRENKRGQEIEDQKRRIEEENASKERRRSQELADSKNRIEDERAHKAKTALVIRNAKANDSRAHDK